MKRSLVLVLFTLVGLVGSVAWASSAREDSAERLQNAANVLNEIMSAPDKGIPEEVVGAHQLSFPSEAEAQASRSVLRV